MTTATLPNKVTATLADREDPYAIVYHLADRRGYTHHLATVRIVGEAKALYDGSSTRRTYRIEQLGRDGWHEIAKGTYHRDDPLPEGRAVLRAVAILFGMEDLG